MFLLARRARTAEAIREGEAGLATPAIAGATGCGCRRWSRCHACSRATLDAAERDARAVLEASGDELARALATNALALAADGRGASPRRPS